MIMYLYNLIESGMIEASILYINDNPRVVHDDSQLLHRIVMHGHLQLIKLLIEKYKIDVNIINNVNQNCLHVCIAHLASIGNEMCYNICNYLIQQGIDLYVISRIGTPLHSAIIYGSISISKLLISKMNNFNIRCRFGFNTLDTMLLYGYIDLFHLAAKKCPLYIANNSFVLMYGYKPRMHQCRHG